jgi:DNA helicase-2/ATP-dependent DNA helicase PcrA
VRLSTVHRVKGLEWPHVVVHEAGAGLFPHRLADDVEEERRVFHVALTRCSADVVVVAPAEAPSPFLGQLVTEAPAAPVEAPGPRPARRAPTPTAAPKAADTEGPEDAALRERLKAWRLERARTDGVPAYVVFNDKTLDDLVARRPTDYAGLRACRGIGPAKVDNYGDDLLALIAAAP